MFTEWIQVLVGIVKLIVVKYSELICFCSTISGVTVTAPSVQKTHKLAVKLTEMVNGVVHAASCA